MLNRRDFLKVAVAAGVVAINGVSIVDVMPKAPAVVKLVATPTTTLFNVDLWSKDILATYKKHLVMSALTNANR